MIIKKRLNEVYENVLQHSLVSLWYAFKCEDSFENSKTDFLDCLLAFLGEKKLRLAKKGQFLEGTIEEQVELFKGSFPNEERMNEIESYWWYLDDCPAGAVWIVDEAVEGFTTPTEDGKYYFWT